MRTRCMPRLALHDGAGDDAAAAIVGAEAAALAALRLNDGAGSRRDGACSGGRHFGFGFGVWVVVWKMVELRGCRR
jgi:hypothetical protein